MNTAAIAREGFKERNQVMTDTMRLLSYTLIFGGIVSWLSLAMDVGQGVALGASILAIVLIWFVLPKVENGSGGVPIAFSIAGLLGFSIGPMLNHYLSLSGGTSIVINALVGTGVAFFTISHYVKTTKKDFSYLNGFVFFALIAVIVLSLLNFFFIESSMLSLGISFAVVLLMGAFLLSEMSSLVNGGETNYVRATIGIYLSLHNMFVALMHILGSFSNDD